MLNDAIDPFPRVEIVDFHNHFVGPAFALTTLAGVPPAQQALWVGVNHMLAEPEARLSSLADRIANEKLIYCDPLSMQELVNGARRSSSGAAYRVIVATDLMALTCSILAV